jgi:hypothetical protein
MMPLNEVVPETQQAILTVAKTETFVCNQQNLRDLRRIRCELPLLISLHLTTMR